MRRLRLFPRKLISFVTVLFAVSALALPAPHPGKSPLAIFGKVPTAYSSGGFEATFIAVADLNGDGIPDLVVANACTSNECTNLSPLISVLLGNGDGTFQAAVAYNSGGYSYSYLPSVSVAVADVNGDGHPDLIVAVPCQTQDCDNSSVSILLGNGDGTFQPPVIYNAGGLFFPGQAWLSSGGQWVAAGDLRGIGKPDLILAIACQNLQNCNGNEVSTVSVLLNNGDGTFQAPISYSTGADLADSVGVADVNGDGKLDVIVVDDVGPSGDESAISVLLGNGDGTLQAPVTYYTGEIDSNGITIGDLNGDGIPDLVVGTRIFSFCFYECNPYEAPISIFLGNGDGTFQPAATLSTEGLFANSIAIADVNGDGTPDLVVAQLCAWNNPGFECSEDGTGAGQLAVLLGKGDGTFSPLTLYGTGGMNAASVAVADVNADGRPDVILANQCALRAKGGCASGGAVGVLLNTFSVVTTTNLTSSLNPSSLNQSVTFTATLSASLAIPEGELVTFYNGATELGTGATLNGVATITTSFSAAGKYTIKSVYAGDAWHRPSSRSLKQTVKP
jgi:hypothetical protein